MYMHKKFIFSDLPKDIINYILSYTGKIYYHKGIYISKLHMQDKKYEKIHNIPKPIRLSYDKYNLYLLNKYDNVGYILQFTLNLEKNIILLQIMFSTKINSYSFDKIKTIDWYITKNNIYTKWRRVISYDSLNLF